MYKREKFVFFFRANSPFSQWHPSPFVAVPLFQEKKEQQFQTCEHWMMYNKALLFNDEKSAQRIMSTSNCEKIKAIGRQVKNFNEKLWRQHRENIVFQGNIHKFQQNPHLLSALRATQSATLVVASPYDRIWGTGLDSKSPCSKQRNKWRGLNLLGEILTQVRNKLQ